MPAVNRLPDPSQQPPLPPADELMLPHPKDAPAACAERPTDQPVPPGIGGELALPEWPVVRRDVGMPGALMPETAVHEDRQPESGENEIRPAEDRLTPSPAGDPVLAEEFDQGEFNYIAAAASW